MGGDSQRWGPADLDQIAETTDRLADSRL